MTKIRKCITIDDKISDDIKKESIKQGRNFSNMIEQIVKQYFTK